MQLIKLLTLTLIMVLVSTAQAQQLPGQQLGKIELSSTSLAQADGGYTATITATLTDTEGKPFTGANVYFNSNKGNLSTSSGYIQGKGWLVITDSNGKGSTVLTLTSLESATVTTTSGDKSTTITVGQQPSTASVTIQPTAVETAPPLPTEVKVTGTATATSTATPTATTTVMATVTATSTPDVTATVPEETAPEATEGVSDSQTPGFGLTIALLTVYGAIRFVRRKNYEK